MAAGFEAEEEDVAPRSNSPTRGRPSLLVVDDEPLLAEYVASVAQEAGWAVEMVFTAADFDRRMEGPHPDVIALDLAMPGRDGIEMLRNLASERFEGGLIIVSACDRPIVETSANLGREHGLAVSGFLQKPIDVETFLALLDRAAEKAPGLSLDRGH